MAATASPPKKCGNARRKQRRTASHAGRPSTASSSRNREPSSSSPVSTRNICSACGDAAAASLPPPPPVPAREGLRGRDAGAVRCRTAGDSDRPAPSGYASGMPPRRRAPCAIGLAGRGGRCAACGVAGCGGSGSGTGGNGACDGGCAGAGVVAAAPVAASKSAGSEVFAVASEAAGEQGRHGVGEGVETRGLWLGRGGDMQRWGGRGERVGGGGGVAGATGGCGGCSAFLAAAGCCCCCCRGTTSPTRTLLSTRSKAALPTVSSDPHAPMSAHRRSAVASTSGSRALTRMALKASKPSASSTDTTDHRSGFDIYQHVTEPGWNRGIYLSEYHCIQKVPSNEVQIL
eukprot:Rhum_TRINITY_DN14637_c21_g1::Rhum_TRINITY_DN14637_c21_g1_i1::g.102766::m.102766